jgi:hypothetical protein
LSGMYRERLPGPQRVAGIGLAGVQGIGNG